ncbi:MAG: tetratricopeptide repeat protein [Lachnospiraceae bacterium]|nr:tetratricopeptide repeat protein [Lachnospiraceae bacterium]
MEEKNTTLADILSWFRINITEGKPESYFEEFDVYATPEISRYGEYRLSDPCCLGEKMILEDDDEEQHPPKEIEQMGLKLYCYGLDIYHVITNAVKSKPNMDDEELLYALNYFAITENYVVYRQGKILEEPRFNIAVFPNFSKEKLEERILILEPAFLKRNDILEYPAGSVMIGEGAINNSCALCNLLSYQSKWALSIILFQDHWSYYLYKNGLPVSYIRNLYGKSKKKYVRLLPNVQEFMEAFSKTDSQILENYLKTDEEVIRSEKQWAKWEKGRHKDAVQTSENMQSLVSPNANRIVFDLLNYLGFPIEEECRKISRLLFIKHLKENGFQVEEGDDEGEVEEDAYYYYCEANEHYNNGQIEEAIQLFLKSLNMDYHFKTYEKLYWCYHSLHQYDLANYFIKRAYEENNNNDKVAYLYAKVLIDKKELDKAREILLSIIKRNPSYKKAEQEYLKILIGKL